MEEKKNYILKAETGKFTLKGMDVQLILEKVREYTKYAKKWTIGLIIIIIFQFLFILWQEKILIYIAINIFFIFVSLYIGYKAVRWVKEIEKIIK